MAFDATSPSDPQEWLAAFARCVRERDYAQASRMFDSLVVSFGTVSRRASGLDSLREEQWRSVWERTEAFAFDLERTEVWAGAGDLVVAATLWSSTGIDPDGQHWPRSGRATIVLRRESSGLRALHTHFSMVPGTDA